MRTLLVVATVVLAIAAGRPLFAQSEEELAKQTQNPVADLISVPFQGNWDFGIGDREATGTTLNIQPVAPFGLTAKWNVILRVIMPVLSQPADGLLFARQNRHGHLGRGQQTSKGRRPVSFMAAAGPAVASPTGRADWRLRFVSTFLFPR